MTDYEAIVTDYIAVWNQTDAAKRAELAAELFTADARYVDPMAVAEGLGTLVATIGAVQQQFPGWTFRLVGPVDGHHDQVRFSWELGPDGTQASVVGFDVAVLTDQGKVAAVHGFLDKVPATA